MNGDHGAGVEGNGQDASKAEDGISYYVRFAGASAHHSGLLLLAEFPPGSKGGDVSPWTGMGRSGTRGLS